MQTKSHCHFLTWKKENADILSLREGPSGLFYLQQLWDYLKTGTYYKWPWYRVKCIIAEGKWVNLEVNKSETFKLSVAYIEYAILGESMDIWICEAYYSIIQGTEIGIKILNRRK